MPWSSLRVVGRLPELFRRERPDVVVLDLKMPEMDGMAVLQHIRNLNPGQPVIILTGSGTSRGRRAVPGVVASANMSKRNFRYTAWEMH